MKLQLLLFACVIIATRGHPSGKSIGSGNVGRTAGNAYQASYGSQGALGQQYFTSSQDGSYDFGYNTGTGAYQKETKQGNQVTGKYGSSGPDGSYVNVEYQAISTGEDGGGSYGAGGASGRYAGGGSSGGGASSNVRYGSSGGYSSGSSGQYGGGASQFGAGGAGRFGASAGQYGAGAGAGAGYGAGAGAGSGAGYGAGAGAGSGARVGAGAGAGYGGGFSTQYNTGRVAPSVAAPAYAAGGASYGAAAGAGQYRPAQQVYGGSNRPVEFAQFNLERKGDGTYSYNYQSSDGSKQETKTGDGEVQGSYTYRGDDGVQRTVGYTAGENGFLASGDHLPRTDDGVPAAGTNEGAAVVAATKQAYKQGGGDSYSSVDSGLQSGRTASAYGGQQGYSGGAAFQGAFSGTGSGHKAYQTGRSSGGAGSYDSGAYSGGGESPKPFAFTYNTGSQSRQESQDAAGVVRGSYTVNTPDGAQKQLVYQADDSGFHIVDEKQVEAGGSGSSASYSSGGGTTYTAGAGAAFAPAAGAGAYSSGRSAVSGQAYKQKSAGQYR